MVIRIIKLKGDGLLFVIGITGVVFSPGHTGIAELLS